MNFSVLFAVTIIFLTLVINTDVEAKKKKSKPAPPPAAIEAPKEPPAVPAAPVNEPAAVTVPPAKEPPAVTVPPAKEPDKASAADPKTAPVKSVVDVNDAKLKSSAAVVDGTNTVVVANVTAGNSTVTEDEMSVRWSEPNDQKIPIGGKIPTLRLGNTRFVVFRKRENWFRAHEQCRRHGMNLATFSTEQVYDEVIQIIFDMSVPDLMAVHEWLGGRRYWFGLNDLSGEGDWRWIDTGERINYTSKWYGSRVPSHKGEEAHCGILWNPNFEKGKKHTIDDSICTGDRRYNYFICEHHKDMPRIY